MKTVLIGPGFLGSYIARTLIQNPSNTVALASRSPQILHSQLAPLGRQILAPAPGVDITRPETLPTALEGADSVVNLVGVLHGSRKKFYNVQVHGAEHVAQAAEKVGAKIVHISTIGADPESTIYYTRTKALGEQAVLAASPSATIIRPSLIFGPSDSFFSRFGTLARILPFLPVFGGGKTRFQPVYAGDVARAVEICLRPEARERVAGKIVEAGGPDILTYREIMELVLEYTQLSRPIVSLPFWVGKLQGLFLERLPESIFTLTRDQVEQLKRDNVVTPLHSLPDSELPYHISFRQLLGAFPPPGPSSAPPSEHLTSVTSILPTYLSPKGSVPDKRTHGRNYVGAGDGERLKAREKERMRRRREMRELKDPSDRDGNR